MQVYGVLTRIRVYGLLAHYAYLLTYLTLLYLLYLLPWFKAFRPEAHAHKLFYALKETKFTVYRYAGIRAAGSLQPAGGQQQVGGLKAAAGWRLQAGGCKVCR